MASEAIETADDLLAQVRKPRPIAIDSSVVRKGIDNYHVDVQLSDRFVSVTRLVIEDMAKRAMAGKRPSANQQDIDDFRAAYVDIISDSLHRTKTDLNPAQVRILHFAVIKFILGEVRRRLDTTVNELEETLAQQQYSGSRSLLVTQEKFTWLRQQYSAFQFRISRAILKLVQREETHKLRPLREQFLGDDFTELPHVLLNPMLAAASPKDPLLLLETYALSPNGGKGLAAANDRLEALVAKRLDTLPIEPLKPRDKIEGQMEVYDELGGLFAVQDLLGPAPDQKHQLEETFDWLDHPGNVRLLFDPSAHEKLLVRLDGRRAQWRFKSDAKKFVKIGLEAAKTFAPDEIMKIMVAGYVLRDEWVPAWDNVIDVASASAYVAGQDTKKILARIDRSREGAEGVIKKLDELAKEVNRVWKEEIDEIRLRVLCDLARFRLHLKYYRFAHRMFNRITVVTDPQQIQLSKANGHLYQLLGGDKDETAAIAEPQLIHHAVLKADIRGSTTVTQELIRQNLDPASYFSTRFFGPINEMLEIYGGEKVFIEGDAIILGIYEYDQSPEQWYAVSRICGIAKEILDIVTSKNAQSKATGLPVLEAGIGICYQDDRPLFLFDEDKPIMISPAIGDADRMSSCSWRLREAFQDAPFNVHVLEMADDDASRGEKGQSQLRYNVNGILLANEAFAKLKNEIQLKKLKITVGEARETMYTGRFPDARGKERDLVIREGVVGRWDGRQAHAGDQSGERFYEVLPNSKLASQVLEAAKSA